MSQRSASGRGRRGFRVRARRARVAGPWYHSPKAALSGLAVLIAWGLLLPGATPVGGGMSTLGSLSHVRLCPLFHRRRHRLPVQQEPGAGAFLLRRRGASSCSGAGSSSVIPARTGRGWPTCSSISRSSAKAGMKALAGGFMTTLEVGDHRHAVRLLARRFPDPRALLREQGHDRGSSRCTWMCSVPAHHRAGVPYPLRRAVHRHLPAADGIRHPDPHPEPQRVFQRNPAFGRQRRGAWAA